MDNYNEEKSYGGLSKAEKARKAAKKRLKRFILCCVIVLCLCISCVMEVCGVWTGLFSMLGICSVYVESSEYPLAVTVCDVGSANCVLIRCEGYNVLVDCGLEKLQGNVLNKLKAADTDMLDLVILTHPDKDHIGNMRNVVDSVAIQRFVTCRNGDYELTDIYNELVSKLEYRNIAIEYAECGAVYVFGNMTLRVVSPNKVYDSSNDNSVVIRLEYGEFSMLLTGDAGKAAENDMLDRGENITADVLLAGHHGSGSSTTGDFLSAVDPSDAVISVEQSDYLPNDSTMQRLIEYGCTIYRTDKSGDITIVSDGTGYKILTQY